MNYMQKNNFSWTDHTLNYAMPILPKNKIRHKQIVKYMEKKMKAQFNKHTLQEFDKLLGVENISGQFDNFTSMQF